MFSVMTVLRGDRKDASTTSTASVTTSQNLTAVKKQDGDSAVVYQRGPISALPDDFARKEMFEEINAFEGGWEVELTKSQGSDVIQAFFYSPSGEAIGPFAKARRQAVSASKSRKELNQSQT